MPVFFFCVFFFFFFKQKTAYEILRSDWSSDVCSSDLASVRTKKTRLVASTSPSTLRPPTNWVTPVAAVHSQALGTLPARRRWSDEAGDSDHQTVQVGRREDRS